ncbi:terminase small subunit [Pelagicoccus enzymogenes]|uniref:terminase small subunit n=1 Tax=Pelagicoccus enzymogenes TaxID=2773457 RepID=UPI00280E7D6F|nr:terminase small subunit [Pelagicoccus enzymogenes]MDQ8200688.1 terminase small subunit [Pelagicoccus enzymogenes]
MAAPEGNQFWRARSSHGPKPKFANGEDLWAACLEYFQWVEDNPLKEEKAFSYQGTVTTFELKKMRAMTLEGLSDFLDISPSTWREWRNSRDDLWGVIERVERVVRIQKFEGAAADLLNPNIIARDLGLADRKALGSDPDNPLPPIGVIRIVPSDGTD